MSSINYKAYRILQKEIGKLSQRKNADYGSNALVEFGNYGILIRLSDKFDRLKNLYKKGINKSQIKNEKITDTLQDIINYSMYMILQE